MTGKRHYVQLTLDNVTLSEEDLKHTPSAADGLSASDEMDLRIYGCEYIQLAGKLLKLPQIAMAVAMNMYQRYYYRKSMVVHDFETCAKACIFLAAKIEENSRRSNDVLNVCHYISRVHGGDTDPTPLDAYSKPFMVLKNEMIKAERRVLNELGFSVHIQHPHKLIANYLQVLTLYANTELAQIAWSYMNDSFRTNVFCRFPPHIIAAATIYLATNMKNIVLPSNPPWYELFDGNKKDIEEVSKAILFVVHREKKPWGELKANVHTLLKERNAKIEQLRIARRKERGEAAIVSDEDAEKVKGQSVASPAKSVAQQLTEDNGSGDKSTDQKDRVRPPRIRNTPESDASYKAKTSGVNGVNGTKKERPPLSVSAERVNKSGEKDKEKRSRSREDDRNRDRGRKRSRSVSLMRKERDTKRTGGKTTGAKRITKEGSTARSSSRSSERTSARRDRSRSKDRDEYRGGRRESSYHGSGRGGNKDRGRDRDRDRDRRDDRDKERRGEMGRRDSRRR
ncbi:hypothetical protein SARC_05809 [Sphaeroforma arctica JP610]|uniref:Cyclin-like domain-containing protein n=1 Tax=Sphaeroforma arctica JP610 TaxID=667725 RepID=A0A0L0FZA2_9EUKA|nr:hypothetical protein SARC_05809 [Sphaeroforma arctica JP610]KNC81896.1 hypothetical protein SARC_05809 [Sphaeroforma arctica JP610]|eukprot:XP_014155798.1 hypothetical protein SARC_05809 [Sphaeroforma arctica JP610]